MMHSSQTNIRDRQVRAFERIAIALERMAPPATVPNYQFPLEAFASFSWESIGATVERIDRSGAAVVSWQGMQFIRRAPSNRFRDAVWFSHCVGKDERGEPIYERLITFRPLSNIEVQPLPEKFQQVVGNGAIALG